MEPTNHPQGGFKPGFPQPGMTGMPTGGMTPGMNIQMPGSIPQGGIPQGGIPQGALPNPRTFVGAPMKGYNNMGLPIGQAEQDEKKREFARGLYISGFEKTLTAAMLRKELEQIKTVHALKLPMTKLNENKRFAFVYFGSEDDAIYVKKKLDRTELLRSKIRVTRTVVPDNLSKMMFKMKVAGLSKEQIEQREKEFFNEETLEREVEKILEPIFGNNVELNKIIVPTSKKENEPERKLRYARVLFYISNLKEACTIARTQVKTENKGDRPDRNEYDIILNFLVDKLNENETFSKYAKAELYEYTKKNLSNVLHIKGIKAGEKEDPLAIQEELKEFIQSKNPQWNIVNCYVANYSKMGAWANVTFGSFEDVTAAFDLLKNSQAKFRDMNIFASLKNVRDNRTVVISPVNKDVTHAQVNAFLKKAADTSALIEMNNMERGRKYDPFSFNLIEEKTFYTTNNDKTVSVDEEASKEVDPSWRKMNTVPRRIIVHFQNEVSDDEIRELTTHFRTQDGFNDIFSDISGKSPFRANHQKGHIKDNAYIPHMDRKKDKPKKVHVPRERPNRPMQQRDNQNPRKPITAPKIDFRSLAPSLDQGGVPNVQNKGKQGPPINQGQRIPVMGMKQPMTGPMPTMGGPMPTMGGPMPTMGGPLPTMGGQMPIMGGQKPMMGNPGFKPGQQPVMGQKPPTMTGKIQPPPEQKDK